MFGDEIVFAPIVQQVQLVKLHLDLTALTFDELLYEVMIGQFVLLEGSPRCQYLVIEQADALGFILNLNLRLSDARKDGLARLTSQDQLYDLEIKTRGKQFLLRDIAQKGKPEVQVHTEAFVKSVNETRSVVFQTMLWLFPELATRQDFDQLRKLLKGGR